MRIFLLFFLLLHFQKCFSNVIEESLNKIDPIDRRRIEHLFEYLILKQQFAYTLFGSKPMSTIACNKDKLVLGLLSPSLGNQLKLNWEAWERHKHLFPCSKYDFFAQENGPWFEIYLVNKPLVQQVINRTMLIFKKKIAVNTKEEIFQKIFSNKRLCIENFNNSHAIYGILLGYGRANSLGFEQFYSKENRYLLKPPTHLEQDDFAMTMALPFFVSFSENETKELITTYKKDRERIMQKFNSYRNWLELSLAQLIQ